MARQPQFKLSLGKLISKSFAIYFRNFIPFILLGLIMLSPWVALQIYVPAYPGDMLVAILHWLAQMLLTYALTGTLTYGVVQQLRGKPSSMGEAVTKGLQAFGRVIGTGIICFLRIFLWSLLLYVPGIIEQCRLYVALPVAIMEGTAGSAAAERSSRLTEGSKWQIFGSWFIIHMLPIAIMLVLVFATTSATPTYEDEPLPWWLELVLQLLFAPVTAVSMSVCYFLLREGKENKSVEELAAVFD